MIKNLNNFINYIFYKMYFTLYSGTAYNITFLFASQATKYLLSGLYEASVTGPRCSNSVF